MVARAAKRASAVNSGDPDAGRNSSPTIDREVASFPAVTAKELAVLIDSSAAYVRQVYSDAGLKRVGDLYDSGAFFAAYIAKLRGDAAKNTRPAESRKVQALRATALELQIEREKGNLIAVESVVEVITSAIGSFRSRLAGLAAASTRDPVVRAKIDAEVESALAACRDDFRRQSKNLILEAELAENKAG